MRALQRLRVPDAAVRQQDRPLRRRRRRRARRDPPSPDRRTSCRWARPRDSGRGAATFTAYRPDDQGFRERELVALAEHDDRLLTAYVEGRDRTPDQLLADIAAQTRQGLLHPVFAGSAATGAGVRELMAGIASLLPDRTTARDERAVGTRVQGGARSGGREGRLRPDVQRLGADPAAARPPGRTHRQGQRSPGLRGWPTGCGPTRSARAGSAGCTDSPPSGSGTGSARRWTPRSTTSPRRPSRRRSRPSTRRCGRRCGSRSASSPTRTR